MIVRMNIRDFRERIPEVARDETYWDGLADTYLSLDDITEDEILVALVRGGIRGIKELIREKMIIPLREEYLSGAIGAMEETYIRVEGSGLSLDWSVLGRDEFVNRRATTDIIKDKDDRVIPNDADVDAASALWEIAYRFDDDGSLRTPSGERWGWGRIVG